MKQVQRSPSQQNLNLFFKEMATDPAKRQNYTQDPNRIMGQYGLEKNYQTMLLNGDVEAIWRELGNGDEQPIPIILISAFRN